MPPTIRLLQRSDGPSYRQLRLEALDHDPLAFIASAQEEQNRHEQAVATELDYIYHPPFFGMYGLFLQNDPAHPADGELLAGSLQISRRTLLSQQHTVDLFHLWIAPKHRHKGLASLLLNQVLTQAQKATPKVSLVYTDVTAPNTAARKLYRKFGFKRTGITPRAVYKNDRYIDIIHLAKPL